MVGTLMSESNHQAAFEECSQPFVSLNRAQCPTGQSCSHMSSACVKNGCWRLLKLLLSTFYGRTAYDIDLL